MKEGKTVDEFKRELNKNLSQRKQISYETLIKIAREFLPETSINEQNDRAEVACQNDNKRRDLTDLCDDNNLRSQKLKYVVCASRNTGDIGVSSVRIVKRKRVKRIYLPETTDAKIGGSEFIITRNIRSSRNRYISIKKSSKCIGGVVDNHEPSLVNAKISPMIKTKSGVTSPMTTKTYVEQHTNFKTHGALSAACFTRNEESDNKELKSDNETLKIKKELIYCPSEAKGTLKVENKRTVLVASLIQDTKSPTNRKGIKEFSSNSLLQHVHDLENPCEDQPSLSVTIDPMENKLEREYRKIFSVKNKEKREEKVIASDKSASVLRRRFDALRKTIKKEQYKNDIDTSKDTSNEVSNASRRNVSINSDPPSLEGRSYYEMKTYSPSTSPETQMYAKPLASFKRSFNIKRLSRIKPTQEDEAESSYTPGVKGMFKLWGKKFNLDDEIKKKKSSLKKESVYEKQFLMNESESKKDTKKFSFFKKKFKETPVPNYPGVTTGRCEVKDGLTIKIPDMSTVTTKLNMYTKPRKPDECTEILRQKWLRKFLSCGIESREKVHIRWNNNTYKTNSSNTVFELMNTIYKGNGVNLQSKFTTGISNKIDAKNYNKNVVNAFMVPQIITFRQLLPHMLSKPEEKCGKHKLKIKLCNSKHCIKKSPTLEHRTEVVLHSNQLTLDHDSSKYFAIDITKDVISRLSSDDYGRNEQSSDEKVYKVVEYDTPNSSFYNKKDMRFGDYLCVDNEKTEYKNVERVKNTPNHRDVEIQGSDVFIPKRCDVIRVGIITQSEIKDVRKPILKFKNEFSSVESELYLDGDSKKRCEFAEKYLQDYYRHFTLLGIDFFSWCVSDSHIKCCSKNHSKTSIQLKDDTVKSCPNIFEDYQTTVNVSSGRISQFVETDDKITIKDLGSRILKKILIKKSRTGKRVLPKDSFEVLKKRRMYSEVKTKSKWMHQDESEVLIPSNEDLHIQDPVAQGLYDKNKQRKKRVLLPENDYTKKIFEDTSKGKTVIFNNDSLNNKISSKEKICKPKISNTEIVSSFDQINVTSSLDSIKMTYPATRQRNIEPLIQANLDPTENTNRQSHQMIIPPHLAEGSVRMIQMKTSGKNITNSNSPRQRADKSHILQNKLSPWTIQAYPSNHYRFSRTESLSSLLKNFTPPSNVTPQISSDQDKINLKQECATYRSVYEVPKCTSTFCPCNELVHCGRTRADKVQHNQCNCPRKEDTEFTVNEFSTSDCSTGNKMQHIFEVAGPVKNKDSEVINERAEICKTIRSKEEMLMKCQKQLNALNTKLNIIKQHAKSKKMCFEQHENKGIQKLYADDEIPDKEDNVKLNSGEKLTKTEEIVKLNEDENITKNEDENVTKNEDVIKLNSSEQIPIKFKAEDNPSVDEIREIKNDQALQNNNEIAVVEKKASNHKDVVVTDVYPNLQMIQSNMEVKRDVVCITDPVETIEGGNLVEIHFKLKLTQGDKTTEIHIESEPDQILPNATNIPMQKKPPEVFVVKNSKLLRNDESVGKESEHKINDINIQINIVHNKATCDKKDSVTKNDSSIFENVEFKPTSEHFDTGSPKKSDITNDDHNLVSAYSVPKIVTQSKPNLSQSKSTERIYNTNLINNTTEKESSGEQNFDLKSDSQDSTRKSRDRTSDKSKNKDISIEDTSLTRISSSTDNQDVSLYNNTTEEDEPNLRYNMSKQKYKHKKEMLKKLVEKAAEINRSTNKNSIRKFKDMMKAILTSESDQEDIAVIENELAKDVTYTSLKPNYFRNTDSMTNYYTDKNILSESEDRGEKKCGGMTNNCMCTKIAAKLKLANARGVCCCRKAKNNANVSCDLSSSSDWSNCIDLVDEETQNSTHLCNKLISTYSSSSDSHSKKEPANLFAQISSIPRNFQDRRMYISKPRFSENPIINTEKECDCLKPKANKTNKISSSCLQSFETKKAVLEIYAERVTTESGVHFVAKLPKFVCDKENEIEKKYEGLIADRLICFK